MTPNDVKIVADNIDDFIEVPDGVERLRKAVLTIAVSGKLVPQDEKEGTAEDLYLQIQKELTRGEKSVVSNKKKAKGIILINEKEILFEIPKTWKWVRFSEISCLFNGNSINKQEKEIKYKGVIGTPYIATKDVGFDHVINYESGVSIPRAEWSNFKLASKNSVFVCAEGGSAGRKVAHLEQEVFFGNKLFAIHPPSILDSKYIFYYCISSEFFNAFQLVMSGLIGGVSINKFGDLLLPLPPLGEQKRIVKKVEEVMKQLDELEVKKRERDEVRTRLARSAMQSLGKGESKIAFEQLTELIMTSTDLKELEGALLTLAVSGKLVPQDEKEGTAEDLYKKIQTECAKRENEGRKKKAIDLVPIAPDEVPFEIPKSWRWVRLSEVVKIEMGQSPAGSSYNATGKGVPLINGPVEFGGRGQFDKTLAIKFTTEKTKMCKANDLILCVRGSTTGRTNIAGFDSCIGRGVAAISTENYPWFIYYFVVSNRYKFFDLGTGSTFPNISYDDIANYLFPLPPLAEQKRIVKKVEEVMVLINRLKQVIGDK